ncbi:putative ribonuclease H-like domain-containing protein [Tanacetum coccineum]|uniref:Ribonuclease H-like domain-containing protein n=1 Tax=Tanacetum coccineum TaxID=301880 RepID=A0ABQ5CC85_9ASTR
MLHMDLFGPTNVKSLMKKSYCLVVTDDFSRFSWVFFLATKDETSGILKTFITEIENQLDHKVKVIRCDNGTEFKNSIMNQFCEMKGIKREFSVARTPQQNGVGERKNRTLIEAARTMILVIKPHNKTPYELIRGRPPLIDIIKPFGCPVTILNTRDHLGKFDRKADEGYFVGYSVFSYQTNGIVGTKDNIVAGQAQKEKEPEQEYILIPLCTTNPLISQGPKDSEGDAGMKPTEEDENEDSDKSGKHDQDVRSESDRLNQREMHTEHTNSTNGIKTVSIPVSTDVLSPPVNTAGPSVSIANAFEEHLFEIFSPFKNAFTLPPIPNVSSMDNTSIFGNAYDDEDVEEEVDMNNVISSYSVPNTSFTKFHKDHPENQAIESLKTHVQTRHMTKINEEHGLISSVHKLRRTNHKDFQNCLFACFLSQMEPKKPVKDMWAIGTKWVFINKKDERGIVVKNKAILVAQGHTQEEGIDYDEVFAPIEEEVYVYQPPGFEDLHFPDKVYKVYVDDIIFGSTKKEMSIEFEKLMHDKFQMSSMGELSFFLGLQVKQKSDGIFISQDKYVAEILKKFDFASVKTASTLMETNKALIKDEEAEDVDVHLYRSMIGSLMYLTASRPDIMFVVCACARFQVTPKTSHLNAVKRIFRYLKGQPKLGLWYPRDSPFDLEAFSDSDYAGASLDRKSTTGGCQFLGKRLISWQCKKQTIVANSTTEAEYVAAANCCRQAKHIEYLVGDEAVHKELGDRMERAATTASSLEAEQDSDTILGDVDSQTRFETTSKQSNDPPLSRGYTLDSAKLRTVNGDVHIQALIDTKKIIVNEASIRHDLKLEDAEGSPCLPNATIFEELTRIGAKTTAWNEFSSTMASAIICLANNQKFNFSKYIFDNMLGDISKHKKIFVNPSLTKKLFGNMKREGTRFSRKVTPLFDTMMVQASEEVSEDSDHPTDSNQIPIVLDLEKAKSDQAIKIASLKKRVEKLERRRKFGTTRLKRLNKVCTARRIESSNDSLGTQEDASKQGRRIEDLDADDEVTLVNETQERQDEDLMFDARVLDGDEMFMDDTKIEKEEKSTKIDEVTNTGAEDSAAPTIPISTTTTVEETLAQTLMEIKAAKPKSKGIVFHDQEEQLEAELVEEERKERQKEEEANIALTESWENTQAMMEADRLLAERLQTREREELTDEEKGKLFMELMEKRRKHFAALREQEKRNRPPTKPQKRSQMSTYLKHMGGYKHKQLKGKGYDEIQKLFDKEMKRVNTFMGMSSEAQESNEKKVEGSE